MPRVPIDPKTLRPILPKKSKRFLGWIITGGVFLIALTAAGISYLTFANRIQTYDLYIKTPDFCQEIADAFAEKADSEQTLQITAYTNIASYNYGTGAQVDALKKGSSDLDHYDAYNEFFDSRATRNIKKVFRTSIAQMIEYVDDTANGLYTVSFIEETNEIGFNMILVYVSKPLGGEQAAKDYFGYKGKKVFVELSENWYYVQNLGI